MSTQSGPIFPTAYFDMSTQSGLVPTAFALFMAWAVVNQNWLFLLAFLVSGVVFFTYVVQGRPDASEYYILRFGDAAIYLLVVGGSGLLIAYTLLLAYTTWTIATTAAFITIVNLTIATTAAVIAVVNLTCDLVSNGPESEKKVFYLVSISVIWLTMLLSAYIGTTWTMATTAPIVIIAILTAEIFNTDPPDHSGRFYDSQKRAVCTVLIFVILFTMWTISAAIYIIVILTIMRLSTDLSDLQKRVFWFVSISVILLALLKWNLSEVPTSEAFLEMASEVPTSEASLEMASAVSAKETWMPRFVLEKAVETAIAIVVTGLLTKIYNMT